MCFVAKNSGLPCVTPVTGMDAPVMNSSMAHLTEDSRRRWIRPSTIGEIRCPRPIACGGDSGTSAAGRLRLCGRPVLARTGRPIDATATRVRELCAGDGSKTDTGGHRAQLIVDRVERTPLLGDDAVDVVDDVRPAHEARTDFPCVARLRRHTLVGRVGAEQLKRPRFGGGL